MISFKVNDTDTVKFHIYNFNSQAVEGKIS